MSEQQPTTDLTQAEVQRRMTDAEHAEEQGSYQEAARLYNQLGQDIQAQHGRFDSRALDAFEGVARAIGRRTEGGGDA